MTDLTGEAGETITGWLLRLVVWGLVIGLVIFEFGVVVAATMGADDAAGDIARVATVAYRSGGSDADAREAAEAVAQDREVELVTFDQDGTRLVVEVRRQADTLLLHRVPPTRGLTLRTGTRDVPLGS